jgi:hypothetical protein
MKRKLAIIAGHRENGQSDSTRLAFSDARRDPMVGPLPIQPASSSMRERDQQNAAIVRVHNNSQIQLRINRYRKLLVP